ncbi:MAG: hypothetical protein ACI38Q_05615 [Candidatus Bruticola sp.]
MSDILLIIVLLILAWGGYKTAAAGLEIYDLDLAKAMALPIGLVGLIGFSTMAAGWLSMKWCLIICTLIFAGVGRIVKIPQDQEVQPPPFTKAQKLLFFVTIFISLFYVHAVQLTQLPPDFWSSFPISRALIKSGLPVCHPFFPWIDLSGHFSNQILTAVLASAAAGDTIRAAWICEIFLMLSSIFLWALVIRKISNSPRAGAWGAFFLFFGVNVGGKAGLMDAFDNGDLLVFTILGLLLGLFVDIIYKAREHWPLHWPKIALTIAIAGTYGLICETYLILVLTCFIAGSLIVCRRRTSVTKTLLSIALLSVLGSLVISAAHGGVLGQLARQSVHLRQTIPSLSEAHSSAEVSSGSISFPKRHFLAIRLGADPYQRFSGALNTALFRHYRPLLDDGGYSSIFSSKVLILHWLPTWLAPFTLLWAGYRRSICGYMFGLLGLSAYFTPAIVDFGPIQEAEYFRWEFAAGVGFSGLMALVIADILDHISKIKTKFARQAAILAFILFITANIVGAQRLVNNIIIEAQKNPQTAIRVLLPWYPSSERWLLSRPELQLNKRDLELAAWLWQQPGTHSVVWREHKHTAKQFLKCAAFSGLSGTLSCEHALPPRWQPLGTCPYLPNSSTVAFQKERNISFIAGLGADWLVTETPLPESELQRFAPHATADSQNVKPTITLVKTFGNSKQCLLYKINHSLAYPQEQTSSNAASAPQLIAEDIPKADHWMYGQAYPIKITLSEPVNGWLRASFKPVEAAASQKQQSRLPLSFWAQGQKNITGVICPPLEEGRYLLTWSYSADGRCWQALPGSQRADYLVSENIDEHLRVKEAVASSKHGGLLILKNIGTEPFYCGGPLSIKWWVWSDKLHNYRTTANIPEGETFLESPIPPQSEYKLIWSVDEDLPDNFRLDVSASAQIGQNNAVSRFF